ncbi:MAG: biotin--[acetyl-CoA-carboxylase] ligase [Oscillospiraceae bacterium]|nr:biotin--[acetyl-CoA-carboxylase] ligase [Oscillospiraceae bacterium]
MKNEILNILKEADGYVSGEKISSRLSLSRSMVWKYIKKLREEGYVIDSVTNKGYRLDFTPDILNREIICERSGSYFNDREIMYVGKTESTNILAKEYSDFPDGSVFVADIQTAGRGRRGRGWHTVPGEGIYMSVLLKPEIEPDKISQITLVAGISVCTALRDFGADAFIKWPNDIVADGKKLCGILTELSAEVERVNYLVCGMGINVHNKKFPEELADKAISMYMHTGKIIERAEIIASVLGYFEKHYKKYISDGMSGIISDYKKMCITVGKDVEIIKPDGPVHVKAVDVDADGGLVVLSDGKRMSVKSGEVSVRGLLGYV